ILRTLSPATSTLFPYTTLFRSTVKKISPGATVRVGAYLESRRFLAIPEGCFVATFIGPLHWPAKVAGVKLLIHSFEGFSNHVPEIGRAQSELQSLAYLVCRLLL